MKRHERLPRRVCGYLLDALLVRLLLSTEPRKLVSRVLELQLGRADLFVDETELRQNLTCFDHNSSKLLLIFQLSPPIMRCSSFVDLAVGALLKKTFVFPRKI